MRFEKTGNPMIIRSGKYSIEKTNGTPKADGTPIAFWGAWFQGERIPCLATYKHCQAACESHRVRNR